MQSFGTRPTPDWVAPKEPMAVPHQPPREPPAFLFSYPSSSSSSTSSCSTHSNRFRRNLLMRNVGVANIVVPKARRPKFDLILQVIDLNNVPLVSGQAYVKWFIEGTSRSDARGRTHLEPIKDHKVGWGYAHEVVDLRLTIGRNDMLQEQHLVFVVYQEHAGGKERVQLGTVRLNLAEYVGVEKETRRYLMQDSKINSTVKIGISMNQVGGEANFHTPFLKSAQVFSGIAGIIGDQRDQEDARSISSLNSKNQSNGSTQDIYRRTLAASWQLQVGELQADECIEDIFSGGDGWTLTGSRPRGAKSVRLFDIRKDSDSDSTSTNTIPTTPTTVTGLKKPSDTLSVFTTMTATSKRKVSLVGGEKEVDELEVREDFVSWRMPGR